MSEQEAMNQASEKIRACREEIGRKIIGQKALVDGLLMGIIADGHVLVEGVPGLAKTVTVKALADILNISFKRIQFTPDLLPADLIGTMIYRQQTNEFVARKGPVFSNIILADEINRSPAKVQSALLEAMAEKQVTIGDRTYELPEPFFVMATQNPIEQEGTYQLPEAQLDRFLLKITVGYPTPEEELAIIDGADGREEVLLDEMLNTRSIKQLRETAATVTVEEHIRKYIVSLVHASRIKQGKPLPYTRYIEYGASPRGSINLLRCARVNALFNGRGFVLPEDVKETAPLVLRHRLVLSYEAEAEEMTADKVIEEILHTVAVP